MGDYTKRLLKASSALLDPGESVLAATPCLARGGITRRAMGAGVGLLGGTLVSVAAAGTAGAARRQRVGPTSLPSIMALGLSERRLLVCRMNRFTGHPSKVVWWTTLDLVQGVRSERGRALGTKILKFSVLLRDGTSMDLEIPREHLKRGQDFVDALGARTSLLASGSEPAAV